MRRLQILISILTFSGCTMIGYLSEQGIEQARIQLGGQDNKKILSDPQISSDVKRKIELIEEYKKFFYDYFERKASNIYSKTTLLSGEAVSYLVIASPHTKIEAHEFHFPFMGSFPYIGFFKKESAESFADSLRKEKKLVTYIRPVYAYSTLGYLEDRILSSFFHYDDIELAELIFHELFHTIFFIKNEVDLNENLANHYAYELLGEYFKGRKELTRFLEVKSKKEKLESRVVELVEILIDEFSKLGGFLTDERADLLTRRFVQEVLVPDLKNYCQKLSLSGEECEIKENWNQASLAAFLTYEKEQDFLKKLQEKMKFQLKDYLSWLEKEYSSFKKLSVKNNFTDHLKMKLEVEDAPLVAD